MVTRNASYRIRKLAEDPEWDNKRQKKYRDKRKAEDPTYQAKLTERQRKWTDQQKDKDPIAWNKKRAESARRLRDYKKKEAPLLVREFQRQHNLRSLYGLSLQTYNELLTSQGGVCAVCKREETRILRGERVLLSVDHDHKTGVIRGLLCSNCNTALGQAKDDPAILRALATYVSNRRFPGLVQIHGEVFIGAHVSICEPTEINGTGSRVAIGDGADIASFVVINVADSHRKCIGTAEAVARGEIVIGKNVFVGTGAKIIGPCTIGDKVVVGAGAFLKGCKIENSVTIEPNTVLLHQHVRSGARVYASSHRVVNPSDG